MAERTPHQHDPLEGSEDAAERVPFHSRVVPTPAPTGRGIGADGTAVPGLGDTWVRLVALLGLVLLGLSWWILDGYQLADSVEYMERAHALVRGVDVIDARTIRSFGFSALLVPFFGIAELLGVDSFISVVWIVRVLQIGIGLALVLASVRIGARIAGRWAGIAAGFLVATNPVFLQYSVSPLSDVAAALCIALAIERLLDPPDVRDGRWAGCWLGLGLLMAYKTVPIGAVLIFLVLLRDRKKAARPLLHLGAVYAAWMLIEVILDKIVYGRWGASILAYFGDNVVGLLIQALLRVGNRSWAQWLYENYWQPDEFVQLSNERLVQFRVQPGDWYWTHLPEMLVWPVIALAAIALAYCLRRATWRSSLLIIAIASNIALLCLKSSKEYRLWIPLLPMMAPLFGAGWAWFLGQRGGWRSMANVVLVIATITFGIQTLVGRNTRKFSGFWHAIDYVSERAAEGEGKAGVACSYHWAVYLREGAHVELTKLERQLDGWSFVEKEVRMRILGELRDQDWFITHLPILTDPDPAYLNLTRSINIWFEVDAIFWDRDLEETGPILVLRRKPDEELDLDRHTLFDVIEGEDADEFRRRMGFPEPVRLIRPEHDEEVWFLGAEYETLPGDGYGWITYYYYNAKPCLADYKFLHRLTSDDESRVWQDNHPPTYGVHRTDTWEPGWIVRESRPVVAAADAFDWTEPYRPIGHAYRRGDLIPAFLWMDIATDYLRCLHCAEPLVVSQLDPHICGGVERTETDGEMVVSGRLERARFGEPEAVRRGPLTGVLRTEEGWRWSRDDFTLVYRLFLPVHSDARVPDNGRPIRD